MSTAIETALRRIGRPSPRRLFDAALDRGLRIDGHEKLKMALRLVCVAASFWITRLRFVFLDGGDTKLLPAKQNIFLVGPTGSGKTFMAEIVFGQVLGLPYAIEDMSHFTASGYVGRDVPNLLARLIDAAGGDIQLASIGVVILDEIDKISRRGRGLDVKGDVSGELLQIVGGGQVPVSFRSGYAGSSGDGRDDVRMQTDHILVIGCGAFTGIDRFVNRRNETGQDFGFRPSVPSAGTAGNHLIPEDLINYGFSAELIGRFGHLIELPPPPPQLLRRLAADEIDRHARLWQVAGAELPTEYHSEEFLDQAVSIGMKRPTGTRAISDAVSELLAEAAFNAFFDVDERPDACSKKSCPTRFRRVRSAEKAETKQIVKTYTRYGTDFDFRMVPDDGNDESGLTCDMTVRLTMALWRRLLRAGNYRLVRAITATCVEFVDFRIADRVLDLHATLDRSDSLEGIVIRLHKAFVSL